MPTLDFPFTDLEWDAEVCRREFRSFVTGAWSVLEPATPFVPNWHIEAICQHLQAVTTGEIRKLIINVPPGSMKSLLVSVMWPAWHWLHQAHHRFLTGSYGIALATRDSVKSRRLIESNWYQSRWSKAFQLTGDQNQKTKYENDRTGFRMATSVGGATGERGQVRILDDPHNIDEAESDTIRVSTVEWVKTVWAEREADPKTSMDIVVMQRVHEEDVCGYLLSELGGYQHLMIPMRYEPSRSCVTSIGFTDPRATSGEPLLFPERWPEDIVQIKERRLGSYGAAAQLQQRPAPAEGGILKRHWWRYWHHPGKPLPPVKVKWPDGVTHDVESVPLPYVFDQHVQSWDMTFKDTVGADFVVGQEWAKKSADSFLLDQLRDQMDFVDTLTAFRTFNGKWPQPGPRLIEDKANGPAIISVLKREIAGVLPVEPYGSKEARAQAYAFVVESGNVFLPHPDVTPWVPGFIEECATFPNASHDDQVDGWSQAMDKLYRPDEPGLPITPEYKTRFHQAPVDNDPTPGRPSFRFWHDDGVHQVCVIGQQLLDGQIRFLDSIVMKQSSIEALIERKLLPLLNEDYRGVSEWRDIGPFAPLTKLSPSSEHSMAALIHEKLNGALEAGEPDFLKRVSAIKSMLLQTGRMQLNRMPTLNEPKNWTHEALNGGYAFHIDKSGVVQRTEGRKFHALTAVGDALGHGLHVIFQRKPTPAQRVPKAEQTRRAKSYAV